MKWFSNRLRFIQLLASRDLVLFDKSIHEIDDYLISFDFIKFSDSKDDVLNENVDFSFDYLLSLSFFNFTKEKLSDLENDTKNCKLELDSLLETSKEKLWEIDLLRLKEILQQQ